jgi:serine/threonine-protein kinase RsbW
MQTETDLHALDAVLEWFGQLDQQILGEATWLQAKIALAEAFTNAVRHAHRNYPRQTPIELEARLSQTRLELRIWDYGLPFDLNGRLAELPNQIAVDREGGRGLKIIQGVADELSYERTGDNRNCFLLVKYLDHHPDSPLDDGSAHNPLA